MNKSYIQNLLLILCVLIVFPTLGQAQLTLGQYRDEAPLRTWNIFGIATASSTGMGYTRYAYNDDLSSSLTNPALLTQLPQFSVALHGAYSSVELFKYGVANTGLLFSEENAVLDYYLLNLSGLSINYKGWGLAFTISIPELYDRPTAQYQEYYENQVAYFFEFKQEGYIRNYNLSISRQITAGISVGLGFNYEKGRMERNWEARYIFDQKTLFDEKDHELTGYFLNGGIVFNLSPEFSLAAVFRTPYTRKADSYSMIRNVTIPAVDIQTQAQAESRFKQPLVLGGGINFSPSEFFRIVADASFFNWGTYEVELFEEPIPVEFKNIVTLNAGIEYIAALGQDIQVPLRLGLAYDPQPMTDVDSKYYYLTAGLGVRLGGFFLDGGYMYGWENGSDNDLKAQRVAVTIGYKR